MDVMARAMQEIRVGSRSARASEVLATYWKLAAERQRIYHRRVAGQAPPWTADPILGRFRFTNAYRAADRVSQDLIRITHQGSQAAEDVVLRTLLYRFFNKPSTWSALESARSDVRWENFNVDQYAGVLESLLQRGERIYSAAYIVPPPPFGATRKHRNHLLLVEHMMRSGLPRRLATAASLQELFEIISGYPSLGPFLGYQLTIDLNYTTLVDFDEDDFVVAGPGARSGIAKCFPNLGGIPAEDIIRWMVDTQDEQVAELGLTFQDLFGRRLKLIDCQNLFCETDKYARVAHPDRVGIGKRTRIKQQFTSAGAMPRPFFPPKWGINGAISGPDDTPPSADAARTQPQSLELVGT